MELHRLFDDLKIPCLFLYLDPGTGSLLFSVVMGLVTTVFFLVKSMYYKAVGRTLMLFGNQTRVVEERHSLVLYSEGRQYFSSFQPLLAELSRRGIKCTFMTSDPEDPGLGYADKSICTRFIGSSHGAWGQLNHLRADLCVMTTPGLDVLQIKRSKHVLHYSHFIHSPTDKAFNKPFSFDYFDSVLVCGEHQVRTIRYLEQLRGTQYKLLLPAGCIYYDFMQERKSAMMQRVGNSARPCILVAPTWGRNGLLHKYGRRLLKPMLDAGHDLIVRPHPQSLISEQEMIEELRRSLAHHANLQWDQANDPMDSMMRSDIMVSDLSGIVFDYAFLFEKPVITVEFAPDKRGTEASDLPYEPWELTVLDAIGKRVKEHELEELPQVVVNMTASEELKEDIRKLRSRSVLYFGNAAPVAVDHLQEILRRLEEERNRADA